LRLLFISSFLLSFCQFSFGIDNYYTISIVGTDIIAGDSLELSDPQYSLYLNDSARYKSLTSRVFLEVRDGDRILLDSNWAASIRVKVSYTDTAENTVLDIPVSLHVDYKTGIAEYVRKDVFQIKNAHYVKFVIEQISDTTLLRYLRLGIEIGVERFYNFDPTSVVDSLSHSLITTSNELELAWAPVIGAEYYEVSWLWMDNYNARGGSLYPSQLSASFRNSSSRISTKEEFYRIPLIYDRGFIVYRVRPVGLTGPEFKHRLRGNWTNPNNEEEFSLSSTTYKYRINVGHDIGLNYQHVTVFNAEGKRIDGLEYLDGLFKIRQSVTSLHEENKSLVTETIYDYQGRAAVNILPSPGAESLEYNGNFNLNQAQSDYSAQDFDLDTSYSSLKAAPLSNLSIQQIIRANLHTMDSYRNRMGIPSLKLSIPLTIPDE